MILTEIAMSGSLSGDEAAAENSPQPIEIQRITFIYSF
jgi:hypothetical protein